MLATAFEYAITIITTHPWAVPTILCALMAVGFLLEGPGK